MTDTTEVLTLRKSADAAKLAMVGSAGIVVFVLLVAILHVIDRARDPISITVSEYVLGPYGWMLSFAALAFGLGVLALTAAIAANASPRPRVVLTSLATAGLGMVVVGAFPTDPIDPTDPQFVTTAGAIHAAAGILAFTCLALAAPLLTRPIAATTNATGLRRLAFLPPAGYAIFWVTGILDNQLGGLLGSRSATGLGERLMAVTFIIWLLAVALGIRRAPGAAGGRGQPKDEAMA
ncbi:DUF998 domain-containing protein [Nonomuraea sp. NPDC052129]|uniref:DUF998 domain-containing protein n=1 Tax=Nonomuraea sp. NPDC052129 TaxID=3154651 RepID=UPI0034325B94